MTQQRGAPGLGPPPVEPLNDLAWSRVERGLWARLDAAAPPPVVATRRTRWVWFAAPALAAAAAGAVVIGVSGSDDGPVAQLDTARVTSEDAPSSISFGDAHVTLDPHTAVVMNQDPATPNALVEYGAAWFAVAPRAHRPPFVVLAGDTKVRVIGTRFRVARDASVITVEVDHGVVEVQHHETVIELRAGQRWSSAVETAAAPEEMPADDFSTSRPRPRTRRHRAATAATAARGPEPTPEPAAEPAPAQDDPRATFERLTALEPSDPGAAITGYLALARGDGPWAELALFAAGRLAHDRHDPRARQLLQHYLDRYPTGRNADDARELLATTR